MKKLYVGNIADDASEADLRTAFNKYASTASVVLITDKYSGSSRGFGFVEMNDVKEATQAIEEMNGFMLNGKPLKVNAAMPQTGGSRSGGPRAARGGGR